MIGLKRNSLLLLIAIGLLGSACGDDGDKDDGNEESTDGTPDGSDGSPDGSPDGTPDGSDGWDGTCAAGGIFDGSNVTDVRAGVKETGACIGDVDTAEACEINISELAGTAGRACFTVPGDKFEECVRTGDGGTLKGIQDTATELSDGCTNCYVASVVCSKTNCVGECLDANMQDKCDACRVKNLCTQAFYECSGFPTRDELNP